MIPKKRPVRVLKNAFVKAGKTLLKMKMSVTGAAVEEGADYLAMMEKNLTVLEEALKGGTK